MLDGMQKSTRLTVLGCACFLAATALIVVFLMFFPVTPSDKHVVTISRLTDNKEQQTYPAIEFNWDDVQHTLSTWSAGVDGFSRSLDDFTATEPETTTSGTVTVVTETEEIASDVIDASEDTGLTEIAPPMPQTETETVKPDVTEPPIETTEPPVMTDPPPPPEQQEEE